jgi:hypothetical protein
MGYDPEAPSLNCAEADELRARFWAALTDKDNEIARVKAKNLELYKKISELATDAYELTVRAEAAEDKLKLHGDQ